jgi:chitinase
MTSQTVNVAVTGDTTVEPNETFTVKLTSPSGATLGTATATGTITNDDVSSITPTVSIANASVAEGNSGSKSMPFTVSLSSASTSQVTVNYATANGTATAGSDYTATSGTLTFAPGMTSQTVNVAVTGDTTVEPNETFTVKLTSPSGATLGTATATGTITNDDTASSLPIAAQDKVLVAYFPEWGIYGRNFQIADVPADKLTHLVYAFADLTPSGNVVLYDSYAAVEKRFPAGETVSGEADQWYYPPEDPRSTQTVWGNFNQLAELKKKYPHLRVNIAIGGWTLSKNFSTVASTPAGREHMADSIVNFLTTYPVFDGVDFDWEYPGGGGLDGNSSSPNDGANYAELLKVVRTKLDALGEKNGRYYEITVASPAGADKIANFNLAGLAPYVDHFNVMAYDFHGTWEKSTGHQSAFTGDPNGYDIQTAVNLYLVAGVKPSQIVLGAPLYTRAWSGVADGGDGGYAETSSGAAPGTYEAGNYDYKDLLSQLKDPSKGWVLYWDDQAQAAYLYNPAQQIFSSFETPTSIAQKAEWAQSLGLAGMMFWDISNDATESPESLVKAAYDSWVLHDSMATIRSRSTLVERIIGGDGVITPLPATSTQV